jgi:hypothetical protein
MLKKSMPWSFGLAWGFSPGPSVSGHEMNFPHPVSGDEPGRKEFIAFVFNVAFYFLPFYAQKSHVKPLTDLTLYQTTTSTWHVS